MAQFAHLGYELLTVCLGFRDRLLPADLEAIARCFVVGMAPSRTRASL